MSGITKSTDPEFDQLLSDISENPDAILTKDISYERLLELQKAINPYATAPNVIKPGGVKKTAMVSHINLRAEYIKRFTVTGVIGFLFRAHDEWEVPAELRRWVSKAAARRERAERKERAGLTHYAPGDLVEITKTMLELAQLAQAADAEAAGLVAAARAADAAFLVADLGGEKSPAEVAGLKKAAAAALLAADGALARARGLLYAATHTVRRFGGECDRRIDGLAALVRQHKSGREVLDKHPVKREAPGQQEMPAAAAKKIIGGFLRAWFEFNPDAHVRSAYDKVDSKLPRGKVAVPGSGVVEAGSPYDAPALAAVRAAAPPRAPADRAPFAALTGTREAHAAAVHVLRNPDVAAALKHALKAPGLFRAYLLPVAKTSPARPAVDVVPPQDTFHRLSYYMEVNMEELRAATDAIYHERPDLDSTLMIYDVFEGTPTEVEKKAAAFRDRRIEEVISDIKAVDVGAWTFLADFKQNREKIDFYNKHTDVLKQILDRHASDKEIGKDLMRQRVRNVKEQNIREAGPDAPGLRDYKAGSTGSKLGGLGAEVVISREEMFRLERAKGNKKAAQELEVIDESRATIRDLSAQAKVRDLLPEEARRLKEAQRDLVTAQEMIEVPDDAIQVDVFTHDTKSGGFGKTKFYTKSETPEDRMEKVHSMQDRMMKEQLAPTKKPAPKQKNSTPKNTTPSVARESNVVPALERVPALEDVPALELVPALEDVAPRRQELAPFALEFLEKEKSRQYASLKSRVLSAPQVTEEEKK